MIYNTINDAVTIAGGGGTVLAGRYRIVRQLGAGGMGSVWLAEDTLLDNKPFAIKMLPTILVSNKRAYRQLKDEALVAMRLTHPNIVTLRAFEENNGNPFLVMDYIDGETLDDYLCERGTGNGERGNGLSEEETIRVLRPIAAALDYAHGEGVIHRDVKPANVMIRKDGHPFILDFGIAREIQETLTRVTGKISSGTLIYMSPEQLNGEQPKPAQDIYSFAAMAYECLKGEAPFVRGAIEDQIKNKMPEPLVGHVVPNAPQSIVASVMSGLAKKPEERPQSCAAVLGGDATRGDAMRIGEKSENPRRNEREASESQREGSSYTQADCIRLMADAKVVQRHLARFLEDPAYKQELRAIEDDFVRADAIRAERQWALAAECYARIVERGKAMEEADAHRIAEEKARRETEERVRREAKEKALKEAEEKERREAEERARRVAAEKARRETEERARREAEERARREAEGRAQRVEKTGLVFFVAVVVFLLVFVIAVMLSP